jgi:uracil-DNA glycosylase
MISSGHRSAKYLWLGEALGENEDRLRRPFVGTSGMELYRMAEESRWFPLGSSRRIVDGLYRNEFYELDRTLDEQSIFITNVCHERPPNNEIDEFFATRQAAKREGLTELAGRFPREPIRRGLEELAAYLEQCRPQFILCIGGTALWAITGLLGITKWRGSILPATGGPIHGYAVKLIATHHTAFILREYPLRFVAVHDMRRAFHEREFPEIRRDDWHFITRPSYNEAIDCLTDLTSVDSNGPIVSDIETPYGWKSLAGHIACIGFSWDKYNSISIPLMSADPSLLDGYWNPDQETDIVLAIRRLMTKRSLVFHNGLFDVSHICAHWGFMPRWEHDTMVMMHVYLPGLLGGKIDPTTLRVDKRGSSLSLAFVASLFCEHHVFWKEDAKNWNLKEIPDEDEWWHYNCMDTVRTYEVFTRLKSRLQAEGLWDQYLFMMSLAGPVLNWMLRGIHLDHDLQQEFLDSVLQQQLEAQQWINEAVGHPLNTGSNGATGQMQRLFYDDLGVPPIFKGKGKSRTKTLNVAALATIAAKRPVLAPLCHAIIDERSLAHFDESFLRKRIGKQLRKRPLPADGRLHTQTSLTGTETLRFNSTEDCFGFGMNLQNINRMEE